MTKYEMMIVQNCKGRTFENSILLFLQMGISSQRAEQILAM